MTARFIGAANLLHGVCESAAGPGERSEVLLDDGARIRCNFPAGGTEGHAVTVSLRPESLVISTRPDPAAVNTLTGTVIRIDDVPK